MCIRDRYNTPPISPAYRALNRLPRLFGGADVFVQAADLSQSAAFQAGLQELERLYHRIMQADPAVQVLVDFGLVNQAEYYTGVVFRGYLPGVGQPVLSGGRYDRLLNDFGLQKPAIGFAIQLDAVAGYLQQTQPQRPTPPAALVYWTQELSLIHIFHVFLQQLNAPVLPGVLRFHPLGEFLMLRPRDAAVHLRHLRPAVHPRLPYVGRHIGCPVFPVVADLRPQSVGVLAPLRLPPLGPFLGGVVDAHPQGYRSVWCPICLRGVGSVSYTHLDVYKRQDTGSPISTMKSSKASIPARAISSSVLASAETPITSIANRLNFGKPYL